MHSVYCTTAVQHNNSTVVEQRSSAVVPHSPPARFKHDVNHVSRRNAGQLVSLAAVLVFPVRLHVCDYLSGGRDKRHPRNADVNDVKEVMYVCMYVLK